MATLTDYQIRQILLLHEIILNYKDRDVVFINLINQIAALIDLLEDMDKDWYEQVKSLWFVLEIKYAMKCAEVKKLTHYNFDQNELKEIDNVFVNLKELVESKLRLIP